ncbi:MAG: hypothetical protein AB7O62_17225 [Pirellulales bacterium]
MPERYRETYERLLMYATRYNLSIENRLGYGIQGIVYSSTIRTAIKCHKREQAYAIERDVYLRLQRKRVKSVCGFAVPTYVRSDDELLAVEMRVVNPPYVLDFAGAYIDKPLPYDAEQLQEWEESKREQFGDRWPMVKLVMHGFKKFGIALSDLKPGNIEFASDSGGSSLPD